MKSIFFSLSLLLLLEKQAASVGVYGGTKGHLLVKTSPVVFIQKGHFHYEPEGAQEDASEESIFVQTKQYAYGQNVAAEVGETQSSQEQTGLNEDIVCDEEDKISQQKSQLQSQSQIKSQPQVKSGEAQLKSQTGQLKTLGQVKSQIKLKSLSAPLKSYQAKLTLQEEAAQQIKGKEYSLDEDRAQVHQQHKKIHGLKRKLGWARKTAEFFPHFRQYSQAYDGYAVQFQEQIQGGIHRKHVHQAQGMCYCPRGGVVLHQDVFTE
ncbi:seminal vesicle secretory protein 3A [Phodopus roborovskii]|uniref:Svs3b protein n=1 Tax=Phodopus roborovskii TaxID=109678 RepID=A0AAU9YQW1_PHORO|nr:seminal vesicle secretory protein 3A [Phodopus roborovskii]CAH6776829.1 Svs3b [Phodopus roborovskii]